MTVILVHLIDQKQLLVQTLADLHLTVRKKQNCDLYTSRTEGEQHHYGGITMLKVSQVER